MRLAFLWQGFDGRYGQWQDGLYAAMKLIEENHEVRYFDVPLKGMEEFNPDVVLYWEAPVTQRGKDADNWNAVCALSYKKALLFAGGPLKAIDVKDFDLVFTESAINDEDCEREGIPYKRAFGVNTQIMKPEKLPKLYDAFLPATFSSWKRPELFAQSVGNKGAWAGRLQEFDRSGYDMCVKYKVNIFDELPAIEIAKSINESNCVLNPSEFWGGGQRATLESLACGIPVICMSDSPKNREYVEESKAGIVCEPNAESIREAFKQLTPEMGKKGFEYVQSKWTERHYASALLSGIQSIL